jgi:NTE family protein
VVSELVKLLPDDARKSALMEDLAGYGCLTRMHVVRLLAPRLENETHTKDIDFTPAGIRQRWEAGYAAAAAALIRKPWDDDCDPLEGVILHEPMIAGAPTHQ